MRHRAHDVDIAARDFREGMQGCGVSLEYAGYASIDDIPFSAVVKPGVSFFTAGEIFAGEALLSKPGLPIDFMARFMDGFVRTASYHSGSKYDVTTDISTPAPWCAPWEWTEKSDYIKPGMSALEMGGVFFRKHRNEIREVFSKPEDDPFFTYQK